jgi:hypothetical protein
MTNRLPLFALLFITALTGVFGGHFLARHVDAALLLKFALEMMFSFVSFLWYCRDSNARDYIRSRWLSVAMVSVGLLAIPYYLWRSRPAGQRGRALLRFFGFVVLLVLVTALGMGIGEWLA